MPSLKQLQEIFNNPPLSDPFSFQGVQDWHEWAQSCRELEHEMSMNEIEN